MPQPNLAAVTTSLVTAVLIAAGCVAVGPPARTAGDGGDLPQGQDHGTA